MTGTSQATEAAGKGASEMLSATDGLTEESTKLDQMTDAFLEKMRQL